MSDLQQRYSTTRLLLLLLLIAGIWIGYLAINQRPLNFDEAQYWLWSQHLSWGYHSKPPIIAWMIRFSTSLLGNSPFGVIIMVPIVNLVTSLLLFAATSISHDQKTAWWTALTFILLPSVILSSSLISTDPFTLCFWALAMWGTVKLIQTQQQRYWVLIAIANALAILSKYTGLLFTISLTLYLLCDKQQRQLLLKPGFYLYIMLTGLLIAPNLFWNFHHGMAAFNHVAHHNANIGHWQLQLAGPIIFAGQQLFAFSFILFPALLWTIAQSKHHIQNSYNKLYLALCLPTLVIFFINSLISQNDINWAVTAYASATPLVVQALISQNKAYWLKINCRLSLVIWALFYSLELIGTYTHVNAIRHFHPYRKFIQWQAPSKSIQQFVAQHPHANYLFNNRKTWSNFSYAGKLSPSQVFFWKADSNYTIDTITKLSTQRGQGFIFVSTDKLPLAIKSHFASSRLLTTIDGTIDPKYPFVLHLYQLNNLVKLPFK
jgi:4-amino-4-deoxy-L-arabinose transferase-like glycosyltransferase